MGERQWHEGQMVSWPKVTPYIIVQLIGSAGNIHVAETGRYHVYWHREKMVGGSMQTQLIHHGGPDGFPTLQTVKNQHERVILRYVGMAVDIPQEEEEEETIPDQTFPQLAQRLSIEIPGEQQRVGEWVNTLQKVSRDLPQIRSHGALSQIREDLAKLLEGNLSRSLNRYKQLAASSLVRGLEGSRGALLSGLNDAQLNLLLRAQQTVTITLGTMQRYNDLERLQIGWNEIVAQLPSKSARVIDALAPTYDPQRRERAVVGNLYSPNLGIEAQLAQLKGEPYSSRAMRFLYDLQPARRLWEERNDRSLSELMMRQLPEMEIWKRRIQEESTGVNFGKYNLEG